MRSAQDAEFDEWVDEEPTNPVHLRPPACVLIVEDDPHLRRMIAAALTRHGFDVLVAASGGEADAISTLVTIDDLDLVILDVHLPDRSGLDVLVKLRKQRPDLHALFITSFPDPELTDAVARLGARLLAKPFSLDDLGYATISALLSTQPPQVPS